MQKLKPNTPPPADYYANNLRVVVTTVLSQYSDILDTEEKAFGQTLLSLSADGARLLARLLSRKYLTVRMDSLRYNEIDDLNSAIQELEDCGFVAVNWVEEPDEVFQLLTVKELRSLNAEAQSGMRKQELIDSLLRQEPDKESLLSRVTDKVSWVRTTIEDWLGLFCLLFFGNSYQRLEEFVINDLGLSQFEEYELDREYRLFTHRDELNRWRELDQLAELVGELGKEVSIEIAEKLLERLDSREANRTFERRRSSILNALGRNLERIAAFECALQCYAHSTLPPSRERTIRVLYSQDRQQEAEVVRQQILNQPLSLEERAFAQRFKRAKQKRSALPMLHSAILSKPVESIETFAIEQLLQQGKCAWHLENTLPMGLFALAYWEWLYAPVQGAFVNPFQSVPLDLYWPEFFEVRKNLCINPLENPENLPQKIRNRASEKIGTTNHLIAWSVINTTNLDMILKAFSIEKLKNLLAIVVEDLAQFRSGFPDLTVIDQKGQIEFIEVKGPGDQVRPNQHIWIERLLSIGIPVHVWRIQ